MKIAMISFRLPADGNDAALSNTGGMAHVLADQLTRRGHAVTMFSASAACAGASYQTVRVECGSPPGLWRFAWGLRSVDFSRFDVLNAHDGDALLCGRRRPRHVRTFHETGLAELLSAWLADERVAVSPGMGRILPGAKTVIAGGVDLARFKPGPEGKSKRPSVLFVGSMAEREKASLLVGIFERAIRPALPNAELWMVCGRGAAAVSGGSHVFHPVSRERLAKLYQRAWVLCQPGVPAGPASACAEAMACGTPVIAAPSAAAREATCDGRYGWLAREGELGGALLQVLREPELRERMSRGGLRRAAAFSWDAVCARYEAVFAEGTAVAENKAPDGKDAYGYSPFRQ